MSENKGLKAIQSELIVAEFAALKAEILMRARFRFTLSTMAILGTGVFLGLESKVENFGIALLLYPVLLLFLASGWLYQFKANLNIGRYLADVSKSYGVPDWESRLVASAGSNRFNLLGTFSQGWLFILLQWICILMSLDYDFARTVIEEHDFRLAFLFFISIASNAMTIYVVLENHKAKQGHI